MEVDQTLVHTDMPRLDRYLDFPLQTHPSVLQLGGSDPEVGRCEFESLFDPYGLKGARFQIVKGFESKLVSNVPCSSAQLNLHHCAEVLGRATAIAAPWGYDEINLNCGCPSPKVAGKGSFGGAGCTPGYIKLELFFTHAWLLLKAAVTKCFQTK